MGIIKGSFEFKKFKSGKPLTRKQAILAQCYECNGYEAEDCLAEHCPLYQCLLTEKDCLKCKRRHKNPDFRGKFRHNSANKHTRNKNFIK